MSSKLPTFCPHCGAVVPAGRRCGCRPRPKRKDTPGDLTRDSREPWRKNYQEAEYKRNRQEAIERTRGRCEDCWKKVAHFNGVRWVTKGYGGEVHHKVPLADGGTNDASNLTLLCQSCHAYRDAELRRHRPPTPSKI